MRRQFAHLGEIRAVPQRSSFIELALSFMVRGYESESLESLLWYVVSLESLLGDPDHPMRDMGRRLDALLLPFYSLTLQETVGNDLLRSCSMNCMSSDARLYTGRRAKEKARQEHVRDVYRPSTSAVARFIDVLSALLRLVQGKGPGGTRAFGDS
jgi:hypothetical protein